MGNLQPIEKFDEEIQPCCEKDSKKRKSSTIILILLIFVIPIIWGIFFHISNDFRERMVQAIEIVDQILDGDMTAFDASMNLIDNVRSGMRDPRGSHERMVFSAFIEVNRYVMYLILDEAYFSNWSDEYSDFVAQEIGQTKNKLLDARNQLAELIRLEIRETL